MKKKRFLFSLLMAIVMMAMSPQKVWAAVNIGGLLYTLNGTKATLTGYQTAPTGALVIPSSVTYNGTTYEVTSIGNEVFLNCENLTSVTIPNTVTSIGYSAFDSCSGLTSVTIGSGVTSIGEDAFYGCTKLASMNYTGTIDQWCGITFVAPKSNPVYLTHKLCINGQEVTAATISSATKISTFAFYNNTTLTSVTIPNTVTSIGANAFSCCYGLTSVTFNSIPQVGAAAFWLCQNLNTKTLALSDDSYVYTGSNPNFPALTSYPTYTRTMTSQWEALVLPFAISVTGTEDYKVFAATAVGGTCTETPLTGTIAAGTPVLLHLNDGVQLPYALTLTASSNAVSTTLNASATSVSGLNLTGSYAQTDLSSTAGYVLENGQFVKIANATSKAVSPFHAYIAGTGSADTYVVSTGHIFTSKTAENAYLKTAAACTTDAVYYHKCENCDVSSKDNTNSTWTKTGSALGHSFADDDPGQTFCNVCHHTFFRYTSTDNNPVTPNDASQLLGADGNALSFTNKYVEAEGKCVMEFNEPLVTIGEEAFENCTGFTGDLIIPNSVKNIGKYAFWDCGNPSTLSIGSSVESIGIVAFMLSSNLTYVEMKSVPSVGELAFDDNVNKTLTLSDDSYVYTGSNPNFPTINSFSYPRTVTGGNIVTFVLPVSVPVSSINGKVWKFSTYEDDKFKFAAVTDDNTEANVPYLVQLDESATELLDGNITGDLTINAPGTPKVTGADGHVMHIGSYTKQSVASDEYLAYYGFSQASHQFVKAKSGTLNPFRTMFAIDNENFTRFDDWTSLNPCSFGAIDTSLDGDNYPDNTRDYTFTAKAGDVLSFNYAVLTEYESGKFKVYLCNGTATINDYQSGENIINVSWENPDWDGEYKKVFDTAGTYTLVFAYEGSLGEVDNAYITNICLKSASSSASSQVRTFIDLQLGMDDDEETQIIRVDADAITGTGSPMYNLQGQRITNPVKGQIYIQNGKKNNEVI